MSKYYFFLGSMRDYFSRSRNIPFLSLVSSDRALLFVFILIIAFMFPESKLILNIHYDLLRKLSANIFLLLVCLI